MTRPHALVVGGTGMLRDVVLALTAHAEVSVVARPGARLDALVAHAGVHGVAVDWHDTDALLAGLRATVRRGPVATAVLWMHGSATDGLRAVGRWLAAQPEPPPIVLVRGSEAGAPQAAPSPLAGIVAHQQVILGFVQTARGSRWLTHAEISDGVLDALAHGTPTVTVGRVEPWSARPG